MPYEIETKDGIVIRGIPDDVPADHASVKAKVTNARQARMAQDGVSGGQLMQAGIDPTEGQSFGSNLAAGAGKALADTGHGITQLVAEGLNKVSPKLVADETVAGLRRKADQTKARDEALMNTGGGVAGDIAGNIAAAVAPGAALRTVAGGVKALGATRAGEALANAGTVTVLPNTLKGAAAAGAVQGTVQPVGTDESRTANTALGAGASVAGQAVARGAARVIKPNTRPEVKALIDEGVTPTPGQIMGGAAQRVEDGLTSVPILGDAIKGAQKRGIESFNVAAINRALAPIGEKLPKGIVGRDAVAHAEAALKNSYDSVLSKMGGDLNAARPTNALPANAGQAAKPTLKEELDGIRQLGANLPEKEAGQLNRIIDTEIIKRFTSSGKASGETVNDIISKLGGLSKDFGRSDNYDVRALSLGVKEAQAAVKRMVEDVNPALAKEYQATQAGWANFKRIQRAAAGVGAKEGVFTPAQLQNAVKAGDFSKDKARFATGDALMQDLSEAGKNVLSQKVPDSGTPYRLATNMATMGGLGTGGVFLSPWIPGAAGLATAAYTQPMTKAMATLLTKRPDAAANAANYARASGPALALAARQLINARQ